MITIEVVCKNEECRKRFITSKHERGMYKLYCSNSCEARAAHLRRKERRNKYRVPPSLTRTIQEMRQTGLAFEERLAIRIIISNNKHKDKMNKVQPAKGRHINDNFRDGPSVGWWGPTMDSATAHRLFPYVWKEY